MLLERFGLPFIVDSPDIDESRADGEPPGDYVRRLAEEKARAVAFRHPGALIIGSDQAAVLDGLPMGKPGAHEHAVQQLLAASGRKLQFLTGLCLLDSRDGSTTIELVPYAVHFRTLDRATVERYLAREAAYDCAGSFRSEGLGISLVDAMEGEDPTALVGLPLIRLAALLRNAGIALP